MKLQELIDWQAEKPGRHVKIDIIPEYNGKNEVKIWVYDTGLQEGQFVQDVSEINLEAAKEAKEREMLEKLKQKYSEAQG
jgi:hypothetical protein